MTLQVDVFWSFRSPYSYLATPRLVALKREYDLDLRFRPVLPIAVRIEGFFQKINPLWPPYLLRDVGRIAEYQGMTIGWPRPDPIVQDFATREVAKEQPYIYRLTRLGAAATEHGRGIELAHEVSRIIWDGTVDGWDKGDHLAKAAARAGLDLAALDAEVSRDAKRYDDIIAANQQALEDAGHWGVPTMAFKDEPFFGQDRIDLLVWRLKQQGLRPRG